MIGACCHTLPLGFSPDTGFLVYLTLGFCGLSERLLPAFCLFGASVPVVSERLLPSGLAEEP